MGWGGVKTELHLTLHSPPRCLHYVLAYTKIADNIFHLDVRYLCYTRLAHSALSRRVGALQIPIITIKMGCDESHFNVSVVNCEGQSHKTASLNHYF